MLSIDEAIEQFKYDAECNRTDLDLSYAEENEQVAEWLEELKAYREIGTVEGYKNAIECYTKEYMIRKSNIQYDKAIDDAKSVILQTIDNEILVDTIHLRLEQLKERNNE